MEPLVPPRATAPRDAPYAVEVWGERVLTRWSDVLLSNNRILGCALVGIKTIVTHGGAEAPYVECEDTLDFNGKEVVITRKLILKAPAEFISVKCDIQTNPDSSA